MIMSLALLGQRVCSIAFAIHVLAMRVVSNGRLHGYQLARHAHGAAKTTGHGKTLQGQQYQ